jgi:hypothetical protein
MVIIRRPGEMAKINYENCWTSRFGIKPGRRKNFLKRIEAAFAPPFLFAIKGEFAIVDSIASCQTGSSTYVSVGAQ